jgi:SAM-dependent methyltransferase
MTAEDRAIDRIQIGGFSGSLEEVSCPICADPASPGLVFKTSDGIGIWQCPECGIMYASPRFTEDSLLSIYDNEAFADLSTYESWSYERWKKENWNRSYTTQQLKSELVARFLSSGDRILDVGCGTGLFCLEGEKRGFRIEGIDPSRMLTEIGQRVLRVSVRQGLLGDFDPGYRYRGIVVWDVLEHVYSPAELVKRCRLLMEDGGYLFVQVPNYEGLSNRWKTLLCRTGLKKTDFKHFGFPWHLYAFNRNSLGALLRKGGFRPFMFESWSHLLKDGTGGFLSKIIIETSKRFCLSDYITCVACKEA